MRDQKKFRSLNATLMYALKRTCPENSFPVVYLASKYNKATEDDYGKAMRIALGCEDVHSLILAPKSLQSSTRMVGAILDAASASRATRPAG